MSKKKPAEIMIEVEGANQDEALENAEIEAKKAGYKRVSLKNIEKITYSVLLFDLIKKPKIKQPQEKEE